MKRKFIIEINCMYPIPNNIGKIMKAIIKDNDNIFVIDSMKPYVEKSSCKHWKTDGIQPKWCWKSYDKKHGKSKGRSR